MTSLFNPTETLETICAGMSLSEEESHDLFSSMVRSELDGLEIAALLAALKTKGETPAEIAGAARALRDAAAPFPDPPADCCDSCGTGGDGHHSVNISTAVAFVAAEMGLSVVKHGNRSVSSRCGSADVIEALGAPIELTPEGSRQVLERAGICFLFAPSYHPGLKHVMPIRRQLRTRTLFNLIGPLINPARPPYQMMGVYDPALTRPLAETLGRLSCRRALVVHGAGLDELALHGRSHATLFDRGRLQEIIVDPRELDVTPAPISALKGGDPAENQNWLRSLLANGGTAAHRDVVALNAGALAWVCERADSLADGLAQARRTLDSGCAYERLEQFIQEAQNVE